MEYQLPQEVKEHRKADYDIAPLILGRWSPRAMTGEPLPLDDVMALFEAARWAPSSFGEQPWRFIYAERDTQYWPALHGLMGEYNQSWTKNAAVLVVVVSKRTFTRNGKPNRNHSFDAGAAWENLAIEATRRGFVAHAMAGFDNDKARHDLGVPDDYEVDAMVAIGRRAKPDTLPESMRAGEVPNSRRPLSEIVMEGRFRE
jgi:nitroreductase